MCLCTRSEENLFTCKSSLLLWLVSFAFSKEEDEPHGKVVKIMFTMPCVIFGYTCNDKLHLYLQDLL